jgi:hypothetical protein
MLGKDAPSFKGGNVKCKACKCFKHIAEKYRTLKHLVALFQKFLGMDKKAQGSGSGYEAHSTIPTLSKFEVGCSSKGPQEPTTNDPTLTNDDYMDVKITIVEFASNDLW